MKSLFSKSSLLILEAFTFTETIYAFDFDGTLAKIVPQPDDAYMSETTEKLLHRLTELAPVAVVTGRSKSDAARRLGQVKPHFLIGNHGLEGVQLKTKALDESRRICDRWKKVLVRESLGAGIEIEDKTYSLTLHYRRSRNKTDTLKTLESFFQKLTPAPRIIAGKCVFNLLPDGAPHKGMALLDLMKEKEFKNAFYIGDDVTDEDVFRLPNTNIFTVSVGNKKASEAKYFIDKQSDINTILKTLIKFYELNLKLKKEHHETASSETFFNL